MPLDLVQIDDGFERHLGDWFDFRPGFPAGPAPLAAEIRERDFTPGLWLAPFIVDPAADWFRPPGIPAARQAGQPPGKCRFHLEPFTTLGSTLPSGRARTTPASSSTPPLMNGASLTAQAGFPLRCCFARSLPRPNQNACPGAALRLTGAPRSRRSGNAFARLRLPAGYSASACSKPCASARMWLQLEPAVSQASSFIFKSEPDMPSARNAIQNSLSAAPLHRRWWLNDPDCLLVRETQLTLPEIQSLATVIALRGGSAAALRRPAFSAARAPGAAAQPVPAHRKNASGTGLAGLDNPLLHAPGFGRAGRLLACAGPVQLARNPANRQRIELERFPP